ncbi:MAG: HAMP domain-containing histidine kinase, partial [Spirochaetia bacterium]|nr:HAMP domain-containing histidine kinase [Spirochaetia bacterium]
LVDILTYTPFTYKNTGYLFKGLFYPILWAMPIAFVIALMMAASISKRSERYTRGIQTALEQLSEGEHDIVLPKTKIDEQKVINSSISMLDQHLKQHKQSRQAWLRSITHDLNTPVTSMKLMLDGITDGVFPLNEQTVAAIKKENDVLSERIAAVVLYATLQSPDMKPSREPLSVPNFLDQVLYGFAPELRRRINVEADNAVLQADSTLLAHAIKALLDNALKACDQTITLSIGENRILIRNPGKLVDGIDFFEPWSRGDLGRSTAGNGLGLPIVGQVMRLHDGSATIEQRDDNVEVILKW